MTAATAIGLIILAAPIVLMVVILAPLLWQLHRSVSAVEDEWARITAAVEAARADIDLASMPLLDRIAHDELAPFFEDWEAQA